jgi:Fe-S-cluster containining protein
MEELLFRLYEKFDAFSEIVRCNKCSICCNDFIPLHPTEVSIFLNKVDLLNVDGISFLPKKKNSKLCIFKEEKKCSIYNSRPLICRMFPLELIYSINRAFEWVIYDYCPYIMNQVIDMDPGKIGRNKVINQNIINTFWYFALSIEPLLDKEFLNFIFKESIISKRMEKSSTSYNAKYYLLKTLSFSTNEDIKEFYSNWNKPLSISSPKVAIGL